MHVYVGFILRQKLRCGRESSPVLFPLLARLVGYTRFSVARRNRAHTNTSVPLGLNVFFIEMFFFCSALPQVVQSGGKNIEIAVLRRDTGLEVCRWSHLSQTRWPTIAIHKGGRYTLYIHFCQFSKSLSAVPVLSAHMNCALNLLVQVCVLLPVQTLAVSAFLTPSTSHSCSTAPRWTPL